MSEKLPQEAPIEDISSAALHKFRREFGSRGWLIVASIVIFDTFLFHKLGMELFSTNIGLLALALPWLCLWFEAGSEKQGPAARINDCAIPSRGVAGLTETGAAVGRGESPDQPFRVSVYSSARVMAWVQCCLSIARPLSKTSASALPTADPGTKCS